MSYCLAATTDSIRHMVSRCESNCSRASGPCWSSSAAARPSRASQEADSTKKGLSDIVFKIGEATRFAIHNDSAYAVLPASYTFKEKGKPGRVEGTLTAALQKTPTGWHMTGFAFAER